MLRAKLSDGTILLGLDANTVKRLQSGAPVQVSLASLGLTGNVALMYVETLGAIAAQLEATMGEKLPDVNIDMVATPGSSMLAARGYDPINQVLQLQFVSGAVWRYPGVDADFYSELVAAESIGTFYNTRIRGKLEGIKL